MPDSWIRPSGAAAEKIGRAMNLDGNLDITGLKPRRHFASLLRMILIAGFWALLQLLAAGAVFAQSPAEPYPAKQVKIVLSSTGGGTYFMARFLADHFIQSLGAPFIIESRQPNLAAASYVAKSAPDGYTLLIATPSYIVNKPLRRNLPYDPIRDFAPITELAKTPIAVVVHPSLPVQKLADLVKLAKARPGALNFASGGIGSPLHLTGELFNQLATVRIAHVPYRGTHNATIDLEAGRVEVMFPSAFSILDQVRRGRLRAIAITAPRRMKELPEVPTTAEGGFPDLVVDIWFGFLAPAGTPDAVVAKLNHSATSLLKRADVHERLVSLGVTPVGSSSADFAVFAKNELSRWSRVIKEAGIDDRP